MQEGDIAKVGEGLCLIEVEEEETASSRDTEPVDAPKASPPPHQEQEASELKSGEPSTSRLPASYEHQPRFPRRRHPLDPNYTPLPASAPPSKSSKGPATNDPDVLATPAMRHLARSLGVNLSNLAPGSGRQGRIERRDIDAYLSAGKPEEASGARKDGEDVVLELNRTRYGMWKAMEKAGICSYTYHVFLMSYHTEP